MDALQYEIDALSDENKDKFQKFFRQKRFDAIVSELPKNGKGKKLLDIGCGPGIIANRFANMGFSVTGVDVNKSFVDYAKKNFKKCTFKQVDIEKTKNIGKFDFIVMTEVIEHLRDLESVFSNIKNSLKPGGKIIITNPNYSGIAALVEFLWARKTKYNWIEEHSSHICTPRRMKRKMKENGLEPQKVYTIFYLSQFVPHVSENFAERLFNREIRHISNRLKFGTLMVSVAEKI